MNRHTRISALALTLLAILGCETRTDKADDGGILLSVSDFNGLPLVVDSFGREGSGLPADFYAQIESITVTSIVKNSGQPTSELMTVEIESYDVTFARDDFGTRTPPRLKNFIFGTVEAGGTFQLDNGPFMRPDQFNNQPIKDLRELGFDPETGSTIIRVRVGIQFFGRTISGDVAESEPAFFTLELVPEV